MRPYPRRNAVPGRPSSAPRLLTVLLPLVALGPSAARAEKPNALAVVRAFVALVDGGDLERARSYLADDARIWRGTQEGPGEPWKLEEDETPRWDAVFHTARRYDGWQSRRGEVSAEVETTSDFQRLIEAPAWSERHSWWVGTDGRITGTLVVPSEDVSGQAGRFAEAVSWALKTYPQELGYLMPDGRLRRDDDRAERWRTLLEVWRSYAGLPPLAATTPSGASATAERP